MNSRREGLARILKIAEMLRRNQHFNASLLTDIYKVDRKTIMRDLEILRLHLDIAWDVFEGTYFLRNPQKPKLF